LEKRFNQKSRVIGRQSINLSKKGLDNIGINEKSYSILYTKILKTIPPINHKILRNSYIYMLKEQWKLWGRNIDKELYTLINKSIKNKLIYLKISSNESSTSTIDSHHTEFRYTWNEKMLNEIYDDIINLEKELKALKKQGDPLYSEYDKYIDDYLAGKWKNK